MKEDWKVSLHGGHSGEFCDHAEGSLRQVIEAGVEFGYSTFGISEHCPRYEERFLYPKELELGWDIPKIIQNFEDYKVEVKKLAEEFKDRIEILIGFETEIIPADSYIDKMKTLRSAGNFDFIIGSVHYVKEQLVDYSNEDFIKIIKDCGGIEPLVTEYYENTLRLIEDLNPEVVGHMDSIKKFGKLHGDMESKKTEGLIVSILEKMKRKDILIDLNARPIFRGGKDPYISPFIMKQAKKIGVQMCFGDDSHAPEQVGLGIPRCKEYLKEFGYKEVTCLSKRQGSLQLVQIPI
jgi:histidinol-phosphatase (PHP family)